MSKIKAIFFDRDNTITHKNEATYKFYKEKIEKFSKKEFKMNNERMFSIFDNLKQKGLNTNNYENEVNFYKQYYNEIVKQELGYDNKTLGQEIFNSMWLCERKLFDDTLPVFKEIKKLGLKIGIISDTTLSLQKTLEVLGLAEYIDCYTSSKEVGVMKPDPKIYLTALKKLNLEPQDCIYIDDYDVEVEGAEKLGFKAFRINRDNKEKQNFDISSLKEILEYIKQNQTEL